MFINTTPPTADKFTSDHTIPVLIYCGLVSRMPDTLSAVGGVNTRARKREGKRDRKKNKGGKEKTREIGKE